MSQVISTKAVLKSQIKMTYPVGFQLTSLIGDFVDLVNNVLKETWILYMFQLEFMALKIWKMIHI